MLPDGQTPLRSQFFLINRADLFCSTANSLARILSLNAFVLLFDGSALPGMISYDNLNRLFAALVGGALIGVGLVLICRHGASLGGVIIVSLYVQEKYGISAGKVQMVIDCLILLAALMTVSWEDLLLSIAGAAVINLIMIFNFKKYRYKGFS